MTKHRLPRLAEKLFDWYCGNAGVDDLRGDMEEVFHRNVEKFGARKARSIYRRQVLSLVFSYAISKRKKNAGYHHYSSSANPIDMINNYIKVAFRSLVRHRYFTILNMVGLAIGMSVSLLMITLWVTVNDYDEFHANKNNIYRLLTKSDKDRMFASSPAVLGEKLKSEFPGIKEVVQIDRNLYSDEPIPKLPVTIMGYFTEPSFLKTFSFPLVSGDINTAMNDPRSVVITEDVAKRVFGEIDPMGKEMTFNGEQHFVSAIMKNPPANTHLQFGAIAPYSNTKNEGLSVNDQWSKFQNHYVYLLLDDATDVTKLQGYLNDVASKVYSSNPDFKASFELQALGDVTPGPELYNNIGPDWDFNTFVAFGFICLLILLPACFNYTNISIARALKRSKEIGLRKTLGGLRRQIFAQFIAETTIVTVVSLIGGCAIFFMIRSEFQSMIVNASALDLSLTFERFSYFLLLAIATGFIAGVLPALHFSRLNPIDAIKNGGSAKGFSGIKLRKALIVLQFALCLTFILTLVIGSKQYRYAMNFDLGFDEENILDIDLYQVKPEIVSNELSKLPFVEKVSMSSGTMGHGVPATWARLEGSTDSTEVFYMFVDGNFIENMDVKLLAGKTFESTQLQEARETSVIINEVMMKRFNFAGPSEAIGQKVQFDSLTLTVIGVIKDFHFWQLHAKPGNFFFRCDPEKFRIANVKIVSNNVQASLLEMETTWKKISNNAMFTAKFLSDETAAAFDNYLTLLKIVGFLGLLAVSISCLGLLGMVVYTAESKTKEVGIRKVMGATRWSLAILISKDFLKLMLIASLLAVPVALVFNNFVLGMDYYHVSITFFDVVLGLVAMFTLAIGTMASQTWRTASINPAETLKYE